ncbi:hypothetical protein AC244_28600 [Ensifer adhaerens]|uniref:Uncharacterized protein n=1 Tax=Ensifer adhaerens TaxID=106592 RepID=A0A0L8BH61_ENSAD|nr:hypothetical protein AC244_28600 [Ensifer adhaerens]
MALEQLSHQTLCSPGIATALDQDLKHEAVLVDGAPQPMFLAGDGDDSLIEVPFIAEPARRSLPNIFGEMPAEFLRPEPHRLVRD